MLNLKGVWRYQRGNQNSLIEEKQTKQWSKKKKDKWTNNDQQNIHTKLRCSGIKKTKKGWIFLNQWFKCNCQTVFRSRRRRDRMVVGFTTTCAINAYHNKCCEFESRSWGGVLDITMFISKKCGIPVYSIDRTVDGNIETMSL
jgi:hypothetical protein